MRFSANLFFFQTIVFILLTLGSATTMAQHKLVLKKIAPSKLQKKIKWLGDFDEAFEWQDSLGHNVLVKSITRIRKTDSNINALQTGVDASLHVANFIVKDSMEQPIWSFSDFFDNCESIMESQFFDNSFAITDLNNNGIAEIWFMFKNTCHYSDSAYTMKIIMFEGQEKFSIRGKCRVKISPTEYTGGDFEYQDSMPNAPDDFKQYAAKLWLKHIDGN